VKALRALRPEIGVSPRAPKDEEATRPAKLFTSIKDNKSVRARMCKIAQMRWARKGLIPPCWFLPAKTTTTLKLASLW